MFKLKKNYWVDRRSLKCDYVRCSPAEKNRINTANSQTLINIPIEASVVSLINSYLGVNLEVIKKADNSRNADGNDIRVDILIPIASFNNYKFATSSRKHLEGFSHAQIVFLTCKVTTSPEDSDVSSIGFDRDCVRRRRELTSNKVINGNYHVRMILKVALGFAEHQKMHLRIGIQINANRK